MTPRRRNGDGPLFRVLCMVALAACASQDAEPTRPRRASTPPIDAPLSFDATQTDASTTGDGTATGSGSTSGSSSTAGAVANTSGAPADAPEVWLKGSTHVHARPSGDSSTPVADVVRWYERHGYDFIVLTDHNKVSEVEPASTVGSIAVRAPAQGLIVLAGVELTHNPSGCTPPRHESGRCRIHVNLLGVTARPTGKIDWADRKTHERVKKYAAALVQQQQLGGLAQLNHPNWYWGMTADLLTELAARGFALVEVSNAAFASWGLGDAAHPSMDALWDGALTQGAHLWGVASDDAHAYQADGGGTYPAGGGWIEVKARRDPQAILAAIAAGHFYASTGVTLARAEVDGDELVVEVAPSERGTFTIELIENGKQVDRQTTRTVRRALPATGYVRAVVTRADGAKAWVQPARRLARAGERGPEK